MADNQNFKCTGNCLNCSPAQRAYCASQHSYSNMKVLDNMMAVVLEMRETVGELKVKVEALQNNEALLFDPNEEKSENPDLMAKSVSVSEDIAQSGDGAESRRP